jgi:hypothetical protein
VGELGQPAFVCALGAQRVEREVQRRDVLWCWAQVEGGPLGTVSQRLVVGDADPHGGLPCAGIVEGVAQRFGFEVADAPTAWSFHRLAIPAGRVRPQPESDLGVSEWAGF